MLRAAMQHGDVCAARHRRDLSESSPMFNSVPARDADELRGIEPRLEILESIGDRVAIAACAS